MAIFILFLYLIYKSIFFELHKKCKENRLNSASYKCYLFGTENNTELGCGQLVQNCISKDGMSRKLCKF